MVSHTLHINWTHFLVIFTSVLACKAFVLSLNISLVRKIKIFKG